jgi:hypothetical protein
MQEFRISSIEQAANSYPQPMPVAIVKKQEVTVTDVQMPFGSMVWFMVKWTIATIPAFLILLTIGMVAVALFTAVFGSLGAAAFKMR